MVLYSYGPIWWPYIGMLLYSYGPIKLWPLQEWPHIVMAECFGTWRYTLSATSPAAKTPGTDVFDVRPSISTYLPQLLRPVYNYGLYSYGLYSYDLYRYGLYRYGLYGYGLYRYGPI